MKEIFHVHLTKWQFLANRQRGLGYFLNKDREGTQVTATHHRDGSYTVHIVLTERFSVLEGLIRRYRTSVKGSGLKWFDQAEAAYQKMLAAMSEEDYESACA